MRTKNTLILRFELNLQELSGDMLSSVPHNGEDLFFSEYYEPVSSGYPKYVEIYNSTMDKIDLKAALVMPDGKPDTPAYLVFSNYEKILKWNRSLRFAVTVCTLSNMIKL